MSNRMRFRGKPFEDESEENRAPRGAPAWMITYGDMMSLLLTLFVVISSLGDPRLRGRSHSAVEAIRRGFGGATESQRPTSTRTNVPTASTTNPPTISHLPENRPAALGAAAALGDAGIDAVEKGAPIGVVYFERESAELNEEARTALRGLARRLSGRPEKVEIRGHSAADPLTANSPYRDHWDLATARAHSVRAYLTFLKFDPRRIRVASSGAYEPRMRGINSQDRRHHDRVEIYTLTERLDGGVP